MIVFLPMLTGCNQNKQINVSTIPVETHIQKPQKPRPVNLKNPNFVVVTENNFETVKNKFLNKNSKVVIYGLTEADVKVLLKNQAELKRYISQQNSIIVYYENLVK